MELGARAVVMRNRARVSALVLPVGIFLLAFTVHILHIAYADWGAGLLSPFGRSDAYYYLHRAWYVAFVNPDGGEVSRAIPLSIYTWIQSWAFRLLGPRVWVPFLTNALLVSVAAALVSVTTRRLFGVRAGWAAGATVALAGPLVFFAGVTVKTNVEVFLLSAGIYAASIYFSERSRLALAAAVFLLVLLTIPRNNMAVMAILLIGLSFWVDRARSWRHIGLNVMAIASGILGFAIVTSWNPGALEQPHFSPIGVNFFVGNAPGSKGTYTDIVGINNDLIGHHSDTISIAEAATGKSLTAWGVSEYWFGQSLRFIQENPGQYVLLQARKLVMLFAHAAHGLPEQYTLWRWQRPALIIAFMDFGLVLSFYLLGLALLWARRYEPTLILLVAGNFLYAATVWVFFVGERYRVPMIVLMAPIAGFAAASLTRVPRMVLYKTLATLAMAYLVSIAISAFNAEGPGWVADADMARQNEVSRLQTEWQGYQLKQAAVLSKAPQAWAALSMDLFRRQLNDDAAEVAEKAIAMDTGNPELYWNLARQLFRRRDVAGIEALVKRLEEAKLAAGPRLTALSQELKRWLKENSGVQGPVDKSK